MPVRGIVDSCDAIEVRGWAWDPDRPDHPVELDLFVDHRRVAGIRADQFGSDLALAGIGNGAHRFTVSLLGLLPPDGTHAVAVAVNGENLENSPSLVALDALDVVAGYALRDVVAARFLIGDGIEIGALNLPQRVSPSARVRYVDRFTNAELAAYFPQIDATGFVHVAHIDDGETLATFADGTVDFVIANNFLEHCQDTVGTLLGFLRVLRNDGVMFVTVPSRRANVDHLRPPTALGEFVADHEVGPHTSRHQSYEDWVRHVVRPPAAEFDTHVADLEARQYSIHFHVFTEFEVMGLLALLRNRYAMACTVEAVVNDRSLEITFVVRKGEEKPLSSHGRMPDHPV